MALGLAAFFKPSLAVGSMMIYRSRFPPGAEHSAHGADRDAGPFERIAVGRAGDFPGGICAGASPLPAARRCCSRRFRPAFASMPLGHGTAGGVFHPDGAGRHWRHAVAGGSAGGLSGTNTTASHAPAPPGA